MTEPQPQPAPSSDAPTLVPDRAAAATVAPLTPVARAAAETAAVDVRKATAAAAAVVLTGQVWGDFEFGELLGKGGMGVVYRGRQISLDRPVAIKVLPRELGEDEQFRERFLRESRAVGRIVSEHVVQVYFAGLHDGQHFYAMEYVDGKDLQRRLKAGWRPSHREALDIVLQAARGLHAAGELGLVHRDIKPGNLISTGRGVVKLMDFGLVRMTTDQQSLTRTGVVMGTVSYFSPEQGRGERTDQRSDLYSLGVVFFELLTGRLPFTGESATSVIYQHIHESPRAPHDIDASVPSAYDAVVMRCLAKRPDQRYASAAALIADLEAIAAGRGLRSLRRVAGSSAVAALVVVAACIAFRGGERAAAAARSPAVLAAQVRSSSPFVARAPAAEPARIAAVDDQDDARRVEPGPADGPTSSRVIAEPADAPSASIAPAIADGAAADAASTRADVASDAADAARDRIDATTARGTATNPTATARDARVAPMVVATAPAPSHDTQGSAIDDANAAVVASRARPSTPSADAMMPNAVEPSAPAEPPRPSATSAAHASTAAAHAATSAPNPPPAAIEAGPAVPPGFAAAVADPYGWHADLAIAGQTQRFRWIPPGEFRMGSPAEERGHERDELEHEVRITRGFWLADSECPQAWWFAIADEIPAKFRDPRLPVENVSRVDARRFCDLIAARLPGLRPRLPTEAEWEYACRAGTIEPFGRDDELERADACFRGAKSPAPVRSYAPNAWGLYDMIGNVREWCADAYQPYPTAALVDPAPVGDGRGVTRGGCWDDSAHDCRAARREPAKPTARSPLTGLRIAVDAPEQR